MTDKPSLFRPQSLEARRHTWLGRPTLIHHMPTSLVAGFSVLFVVAVVAFLFLGEYTRRVRVAGVIMPTEGLTRLVAPQSGWVSNLAVAEGDQVERGDILYVLSLDTTTALGNTQGAVTDILRTKRHELEEALKRQSDIDRAEKERLADQLASIESEVPQVDDQIKVVKDFTDQLESFASRQQELVEQGVSISREYESRLQAFNAQRSDLARLRRERVQLAGRRDELGNHLLAFDMHAAARATEIRRQVLDIEQQISENEARREVRITAPRDGAVTGITTRPGQTVILGTPLLTIVPTDQPLVAQLVAPSDAIGFIREGADVLLRYQAFPYQKFGQYPAKVSIISRANLRAEEISELSPGSGASATQPAPTLYRITVAPDAPFVRAYGKQEKLQAGMQVEAHLFADTRPIYQWILEPIYGLAGSISSDAEPAA